MGKCKENSNNGWKHDITKNRKILASDLKVMHTLYKSIWPIFHVHVFTLIKMLLKSTATAMLMLKGVLFCLFLFLFSYVLCF